MLTNNGPQTKLGYENLLSFAKNFPMLPTKLSNIHAHLQGTLPTYLDILTYLQGIFTTYLNMHIGKAFLLPISTYMHICEAFLLPIVCHEKKFKSWDLCWLLIEKLHKHLCLSEIVTVRHWLHEPSFISVLLASLFHLCCLIIMFLSLKFCISL